MVEICEFDLFSFSGPTVDENGNPDPNGDGLNGWQNTNYIFSEGVHELDVQKTDGCFYRERVEVVVLLNPEKVIIDTVFCDGELPGDVFGFNFAAENEFIEDLNLSPLKASNGCDSIIDLYIWYMEMNGGLTGECIINPDGSTSFLLTFTETSSEDAGTNTIYTYNWYDVDFGVGPGFEMNDGDPDGNPRTFLVDDQGNYRLDIEMTVESQQTGLPVSGCTYSFDISVDPADFLPPNPIQGNWDTIYCASGSSPDLYTINSADGTVPVWSWPGDVASASGQGTDSLTIDWTGSAGGEVAVFVMNGCGNSDTLSATVEPIVVPDPVITIDLESTCIDSAFTISSNMIALPGAQYVWNFNGGVVEGGSATGPGPHRVSWANVGDFRVSLFVRVGDCISGTVADTVSTVEPIAAPIINCGVSTISSVQFVWTPVPGATGYVVTILEGIGVGNTITQDSTTYTMQGMAVGQSGRISVTALTNNPCGPTTTESAPCVAQNCPPATITLTADPDTICLTPTTSPVTINVAINPPKTGTGTFSGNGVNPTTGVFDPVAAGAGTHPITYQFIDDANCSYSGSMVFVVRQTPTSDFTVDATDICIDTFTTVTYTGNVTQGTFAWTVSPDGGPLDGRGPFEVTWPTGGTKDISLTVTRQGCVSTPTTRMVNVDELVDPINVTCVDQTASSITFGWNSAANASEYAVSIDGSFVRNQTDNTFTITGLTPGDRRFIEVIAISNNLCGNTMDTITCVAQNCPPYTLTVSEDTTVCADAGAFDLMWSITGGLQDGSGIGHWSGVGITDTVNGTFDPAVSGVGSFEITLTYAEGPGGFCAGSETVEVDVINVPEVSFDIVDDTICLSETAVLNYTGTPPSLMPMITVTSGGTITQNPANRRNYRLTFDAPGTYTVRAEAFVGSCIGTPVEQTITVLPEPMETITVSCDSSNLDYIRFAWNDISCAESYEVFIDGVSQGIQPETTFEITGLSEGAQRTIVVIGINTCDCAENVESAPRTCEATACPNIQASITPAQDAICMDDAQTQTIAITATVTGQDGGGISVWSGTNVDQNGIFRPAGLPAGAYTIGYEYTEQNGACGDNAQTMITINENPQGIISKVDPTCFADNFGSATFGSVIEGQPLDITLNGEPVVNLTADNLAPGRYDVVYTDPLNGCTSSDGFTIVSAPIVTAEVVGNTVILIGNTSTLRVEFTNIDNVDSIAWRDNSTGTFIPCQDIECERITVRPDVTTQYCAEVWFNDGCMVEACAEVRVNLDPDITVPNIFNPAEGNNPKFFVPHNGEFIQINKMLIYDRWGELVYGVENVQPAELFDKGWDGKFQGTNVNPGVFVYLIEILTTDDLGQPEIVIKKGDVTVIR